jgi:hypothetical protein
VKRRRGRGRVRVFEKGAPRYCGRCQEFKPPRSHHCSDCGLCTLKMVRSFFVAVQQRFNDGWLLQTVCSHFFPSSFNVGSSLYGLSVNVSPCSCSSLTSRVCVCVCLCVCVCVCPMVHLDITHDTGPCTLSSRTLFSFF